jgi:glycosyltransferase involved in cell wall biosynthesis
MKVLSGDGKIVSDVDKFASATNYTFLFVHQSSELYGSDRTFIQSVRACREFYPQSKISILLPCDGPLIEYLQPYSDQILIEDIIILRKSTFFEQVILRPLNFVKRVLRAKRLIMSHDLTYINTAVVLDFLIASRLSSKPSLIHIHEIPSKLLNIVFNSLLKCSKGSIIFNSKATRSVYPAVSNRKTYVIANGTRVDTYQELSEPPPLHILLIGRFNAWKGHALLLQALALLLNEKKAAIKVRFLGSVYGGQHHHRDSVQAEVSRLGLDGLVEFYDFVDDPASFYHWANLVVVPSTLPEPFGLVAIEAMGHGRPVVAADHGGLMDIVEDSVTGFLFTPNDSSDLSQKLLKYINDPCLLIEHGIHARSSFLQHFHEDRYISSVGHAIEETIQLK